MTLFFFVEMYTLEFPDLLHEGRSFRGNQKAYIDFLWKFFFVQSQVNIVKHGVQKWPFCYLHNISAWKTFFMKISIHDHSKCCILVTDF